MVVNKLNAKKFALTIVYQIEMNFLNKRYSFLNNSENRKEINV